jgi:outer membrane protein assembly factor BamB
MHRWQSFGDRLVDQPQRTVNELVFVAFGKYFVALDRFTGEKIWQWSPPKGAGYMSILLDGDRLVVSAQGYMYCLDPMFGQEVWSNPLEGMGTGVPCIASANGNTSSIAMQAAMQQQAAAAAAAAAAAS